MGDLHEWHDFFVVVGAAAGVLIGSLFVVASVGIGFLTAERADSLRLFLTPIITHVSAVLIGCALLVLPSLSLPAIGALLTVGAVAGLLYGGRIARHAWGREIDRSDRFWYAAAPILAYAVMGAAAIMAWAARPASLDVVAAALLFLLVGAIRNAWDMVLFLVTRDRSN